MPVTRLERDIIQTKSSKDKTNMMDEYTALTRANVIEASRQLLRGDSLANHKTPDGVVKIVNEFGNSNRYIPAHDTNTTGRITYQKLEELYFANTDADAWLMSPAMLIEINNILHGIGSGSTRTMITDFKHEESGKMLASWAGRIPIYEFQERKSLTSVLGFDFTQGSVTNSSVIISLRFSEGDEDREGFHLRHFGEHPLMGENKWFEHYDQPTKVKALQELRYAVGIFPETCVAMLYGIIK